MSEREMVDPIPGKAVREILQALDDAQAPLPPVSLRSRLLAAAAQEAAQDFTVVRADEGTWRPIAPGVTAKVLHDDGRARTWLARMEKGATLLPHGHPGDEECLVLEGTVRSATMNASRGDYQMARAGSWHEAITTDTGCLLLLRSARAA